MLEPIVLKKHGLLFRLVIDTKVISTYVYVAFRDHASTRIDGEICRIPSIKDGKETHGFLQILRCTMTLFHISKTSLFQGDLRGLLMNSPFLLVNFPNPLASDCWSIQRLARFQGPGSTDEECCTRADLPVPWPCGKGNSFGGELGLFIWDIWVWYLKMLEKNNIKFTALEHLVSLSIFFLGGSILNF